MTTSGSVHTISAEVVTSEGFAPFGEVLAPRGPELPHVYGDRLDVYSVGRLESEAAVQFISTRSRRRTWRVQYLERHHQITQTFIPLGGDGIVVAVAPADAPMVSGVPAVDAIRAFVVPGDTAVNLHRGTWHEVPFPLVDDSLTLVTSHAGVTDGWAELDGEDEIDRLDEEKRDVTKRTGVEVVIDVSGVA